jgi:cation:H+ antiporter
MLTVILLIVGFVVLMKGADLLVDGASAIALRMNISNLIIGLTVVAFGTSAPELFISVYAAVTGNPDIAISNILGSNMANLYLILGMAAVMSTLSFHRNTTLKEIPYTFLASLLLGVMANDILINKGKFNLISRLDGIILLFFFIFFLIYIFSVSPKSSIHKMVEIQPMSGLKSALYICLGLAGLVLGGHWIVSGAVEMAQYFEVNPSLIGLTIVAVGTSLPELATTLAAVRKGNGDMAIGNVIGSNIFNIFLILGITSIIKPIPFPLTSQPDVLVTILGSLLLFVFVNTGKKHLLQRWHGILFLSIYIGYMAFKIYQG